MKNDPTFKNIFADKWDTLPTVFHKHYANRPFSNDIVKVEGYMDIRHSKIVRLMLPLLRLFGSLVPFEGKAVPVTVLYKSESDSNAYCLRRTFYFKNQKPYHFNSRMVPIKNNVVVEFVRFGIGWKMHYLYENDKVILQHAGYVLRFFKWLIPLPISLILGKGHAEEIAISGTEFEMSMQLTHPIFGETFAYSGKFKLQA